MKKTWFRPKIKWGKWRGLVWGVWEREERVSIQRNRRKWEKNRVNPFYRNLSSSMDREVLRAIKNKNAWINYRRAIKNVLRGVHSKRVSMHREAIKHLESSSMDWVAIKNAMKRSWKGLIDSLAVERCPTAVEIA